MASETPSKPKIGLSLYANLLEPGAKDSPATISSGPVAYKQTGGGDEAQADETTAQRQNINTAALRFQPTKRPQAAVAKKATPAKFSVNPSQAVSSTPSDSRAPIPANRTTAEDWAADAEEDDYYGTNQRQRGGRKRRKKNKEQAPMAQDWDDIYDPSRPNSYEEYKNSDEKIRELREWKDRLYAHRAMRRRSASSDSEYDAPRRPAMQFAPPTSTAPPPPPEPKAYSPPPAPAELHDDATGEEAFARRMRISQKAQQPQGTAPGMDHEAQRLPSQPPAPTISRAPVRYNLPSAPDDIPKSEEELEIVMQQEEQAQGDGQPDEEASRSLRPGQKGFAERLMAKYGWTKGSGLGANSTGIVTPLQAKLEKQKKKPDSEGGGYVGPGGMGKIVGGKKKGEEGEGRFGRMSDVVVLRGMVDGMDLNHELGEGNLMQEIGEECGDKYGRVERVFIDQSSGGTPPVFIKFTSQLSALRAVNALEGRVFNGNTIEARFFDSDRFDAGVYR